MAGLIVVAVNRMPAAEVEVSADLVRRLLADQHPDLARLPVEFLANGWSAYQAAGARVNDALQTRARGWAVNLAIVFLAHSEDNPVLLEVGRRTLRTVLEDQRGPAR